MNISKMSNESAQWNSNWEMIGASHGAATRKRNFIRDEVALLAPDIVITMNLEDRLESLGSLTKIEFTPKVNSYWLDSNGHRSLLLDTYHFSAPGMNSEEWFYLPICEAVQEFGMQTPSSANNDPVFPIAANAWSESLKKQTREAVEELRINPATGKIQFKNINRKYGHITFKDLMAGRLTVHCENSEECFTAENIEELLAAGWAID